MSGNYLDDLFTSGTIADALATTSAPVNIVNEPGDAGDVLTLIDPENAAWAPPTGGPGEGGLADGVARAAAATAKSLAEDAQAAADAAQETADEALAAAGSGGGQPSFADLPVHPHADDEEFLVTPTGWTLIRRGTAGPQAFGGTPGPYSLHGDARLEVNTRRPSWALIQAPYNTQWLWAKKPSPTIPANALFWSRLAINPSGGGGQGNLMLALAADNAGEPDVNNMIAVGHEQQGVGPVIRGYTCFGGVEGVFGNQLSSFGWDYVCIQKSGTRYNFWAFTESGTHRLVAGYQSFSQTFEWIGLYFSGSDVQVFDSATRVGEVIGQADFVRTRAVNTSLPFFGEIP